MKQVISEHIKKIRESEEHVQRWWVAIATTIVMIGIFFLWILYLSATLPGQNIKKERTEEKTVNLLGTVFEGSKITIKNVKNSFGALGEIFKEGTQNAIDFASKKKEIEIKADPPEEPFNPNLGEPLESIQLP